MEDKSLHDWTLQTIEVDWPGGTARLTLTPGRGVTKYLTARDLVELVVPRRQEWGPSKSIMSTDGPAPHVENSWRLEILMQSGDRLLIVAREIAMPSVD